MAGENAELIRDIMLGKGKLQGLSIKGHDIVSEMEPGGRCEKVYGLYTLYMGLVEEAVAERIRAQVDELLETCILDAAIAGALLERAELEGMLTEEIKKAAEAAPGLLRYL